LRSDHHMLTLVLLPGMDGTGIFFEDFAAALQPEFKPIIVRYPNDPSLGYAELEAFARAALPHDEQFLVLVESFSGPIAISIAASNPPGLFGSLLCVTFARNPHPLLPLVTAILKPLPAWRVPRFIQQPNLFGRFDSPYLRSKLRRVRGLVWQKTLKSRLEAVASIDVSDKLRRVTIPTLYLRAKMIASSRVHRAITSEKCTQMSKSPNSTHRICFYRPFRKPQEPPSRIS